MVLMALPGSLLWRPPQRGDLDAIAEADTGYYPPNRHVTWVDVADAERLHERTTGAARRPVEPGTDCPACPAPREDHTEWGAPSTGCGLSIALITRRLR